ncbi:glycosyltransferase family 4 protein [Legionella sp. PATHC038]|uniref:glycosyltransferase family 4 protein n=1 Tax=Legionella sheltonii TaxID=2992041 RepID=UPI00224308BA|nr:glycosyltransferase family 4 protein [Legionella sp. PATHC038]MCW8397223.1 glycosyltransferase family 4 protein [Legionella sp. PATHC038]
MPKFSNKSHPPKFLLISSFTDSIIKFRGALIQQLNLDGVEVHVCSPNIKVPSKTRDTLLSMGVNLHDVSLQRTGKNPFVDLRYFISLIKVIRKIKPDYVLSYTIKPVIYGTLASRLLKVPNITNLITGLGYLFIGDKTHWFYRPVMLLYRAALRSSRLVIFQNKDDRQLLIEKKLLCPTVKTTVVNGSGVELESYTKAPLPKGIHFLLIARLLVSKGIREYIEAARLVKKKYPDATFTIVGWIDEEPDAISKKELNAWIDEGVVNYLGFLEDVRDAITCCNVYVLPSYREGMPRTILEAMAMGRAIITTDAPGCCETVEENVNGFKVPIKSVDFLAGAMFKFIENPSLIQQFGEQSRYLAEKKYDADVITKTMLDEIGV